MQLIKLLKNTISDVKCCNHIEKRKTLSQTNLIPGAFSGNVTTEILILWMKQ